MKKRTKIKLRSEKVPKRAVRKATPKQSERTLHMLCQQWLVKSGWWDKLLIFHVPNERRGGPGAGAYFKRLGVRPGVADYLVFGGNRDTAIELKKEKGELSEAQIDFKDYWEHLGKSYFTVRTLEEFQNVVCAVVIFS